MSAGILREVTLSTEVPANMSETAILDLLTVKMVICTIRIYHVKFLNYLQLIQFEPYCLIHIQVESLIMNVIFH